MRINYLLYDVGDQSIAYRDLPENIGSYHSWTAGNIDEVRG